MSNPTTKSAKDITPKLVINISYDPATGALSLGENCNDSMVFYGLLKLAEKAWDRKLDKARAKAAVPAIELATALPHGPNGGN